MKVRPGAVFRGVGVGVSYLASGKSTRTGSGILFVSYAGAWFINKPGLADLLDHPRHGRAMETRLGVLCDGRGDVVGGDAGRDDCPASYEASGAVRCARARRRFQASSAPHRASSPVYGPRSSVGATQRLRSRLAERASRPGHCLPTSNPCPAPPHKSRGRCTHLTLSRLALPLVAAIRTLWTRVIPPREPPGQNRSCSRSRIALRSGRVCLGLDRDDVRVVVRQPAPASGRRDAVGSADLPSSGNCNVVNGRKLSLIDGVVGRPDNTW